MIDEGARIVVDLEAVGFLDSAGLGILVGGLKRARTAGGELELVCSSHDVLKPLEITGLDRVFTIHSGRDAALGRADQRSLSLTRSGGCAAPPPLVGWRS